MWDAIDVLWRLQLIEIAWSGGQGGQAKFPHILQTRPHALLESKEIGPFVENLGSPFIGKWFGAY